MTRRNSHKKAQKGTIRGAAETRTAEPPRRKDRKGDVKQMLQLKPLALFASWRFKTRPWIYQWQFAVLGNSQVPKLSAITDQVRPS